MQACSRTSSCCAGTFRRRRHQPAPQGGPPAARGRPAHAGTLRRLRVVPRHDTGARVTRPYDARLALAGKIKEEGGATKLATSSTQASCPGGCASTGGRRRQQHPHGSSRRSAWAQQGCVPATDGPGSWAVGGGRGAAGPGRARTNPGGSQSRGPCRGWGAVAWRGGAHGAAAKGARKGGSGSSPPRVPDA